MLIYKLLKAKELENVLLQIELVYRYVGNTICKNDAQGPLMIY